MKDVMYFLIIVAAYAAWMVGLYGCMHLADLLYAKCFLEKSALAPFFTAISYVILSGAVAVGIGTRKK